MPKQRMINTSFWTDDYVGELDPHMKLIYACLFTNPDANLAGIYQISYHSLKSYTGLNREELDRALKVFEEDRKVYYVDGWMIVCNMPKHQEYWKKSKIKAGIINILKHTVPQEILQHILTTNIPYTYPIDTLSISYECDTDIVRDDLDSDLNYDLNFNLNESISHDKGNTPAVFNISLDDDVHNLWITSYGKNPNLKPQQDFGRKLIDAFGEDKAKKIMYDFARKGFNLVETMDNALDWRTGEIKPRDKPGSNTAATYTQKIKSKCEYPGCGNPATSQVDGVSCCSQHPYLEVKEKLAELKQGSKDRKLESKEKARQLQELKLEALKYFRENKSKLDDEKKLLISSMLDKGQFSKVIEILKKTLQGKP